MANGSSQYRNDATTGRSEPANEIDVRLRKNCLLWSVPMYKMGRIMVVWTVVVFVVVLGYNHVSYDRRLVVSSLMIVPIAPQQSFSVPSVTVTQRWNSVVHKQQQRHHHHHHRYRRSPLFRLVVISQQQRFDSSSTSIATAASTAFDIQQSTGRQNCNLDTTPNNNETTTQQQNNDNSNNNFHCGVVLSSEFPTVAMELSKRLSLPLITRKSDQQQKHSQYQHVIVIEPYTYHNENNNNNDNSYGKNHKNSIPIHSYSIGIISYSGWQDPNVVVSNNDKKEKKKQKRIKSTATSMKPYFIDFLPPIHSTLGRRTTTLGSGGGGISESSLSAFASTNQPELLLKALRLPPRTTMKRLDDDNDELEGTVDDQKQSQPRPIRIYDITAGFGQDALLMAHGMISKQQQKSHCNNSDVTNGRVHMIERNPIIATLLSDALRRLKLIATTMSMSNDADDTNRNSYHNRIAQQLNHCLSMECNDSMNALTNCGVLPNNNNTDTTTVRSTKSQPDIVYYDPMFPTRKKNAAVKKNMQILHSLLFERKQVPTNATVERTTSTNGSYTTNGTNVDYNSSHLTVDTIKQHQQTTKKDEEESMMLQMAYQVARYRVVVKRPVHAPCIPFIGTPVSGTTTSPTTFIQPSYQIIGSINRWDVYNKF